jgi:hypothetical protein
MGMLALVLGQPMCLANLPIFTKSFNGMQSNGLSRCLVRDMSTRAFDDLPQINQRRFVSNETLCSLSVTRKPYSLRMIPSSSRSSV